MNITPSSRNNQHLIVFNVAPYTFCAPAAEVESIIMLPPVSRLPMAPPSVIGLINHRGQVYRVISLRRKLGLETGPPRMEGQLILTHLPAGLTAFLVDDVVDVLPDTNLPRRPLSAHSAMDLFDAFILRDEQVLFHTTFDTIDQALETDDPNPDLKSMERVTADALVQTTATESTTVAEGAIKRSSAPGKAIGQAVPLPEKRAAKGHIPLPESQSARPRTGMTTMPVSRDDIPLPAPGSARRNPVPQRRKRSSDARTRRYALALTGVLLLILITALSSGLLIRQHMMGSQPQPTGGQITPLPEVTMPDEDPEPSLETRQSQLSVPKASEEPPPPKASTLQQEAAVSPAFPAEEKPSPPPTSTTKEPPVASATTTESPREILRMETETFTLMVERPSVNPQPPPSSLSDQPPPTRSTIVHRVVSGDTLWDIAEHYLDDPFQYPELARLSQIHDPDLIFPGDVIRIIKKGR